MGYPDRFIQSLCVVVLASLSVTAPASAQARIHRFTGGSQTDGFGLGPSATRGAGDFNGDGFDDIIAGSPNATVAMVPNIGFVQVLSGRDGTDLLNVDGDLDGRLFGYSAACAGDVNQDAFSDVIVGAPGNAEAPGYARVFLGDGDADPTNNVSFRLDFLSTGSPQNLLQNFHENDNGFGRSVDKAYNFALLNPMAVDGVVVNGNNLVPYVVIGADKTDNNGPDAGNASVWAFNPGDATAAPPIPASFEIKHVYYGANAGARFGYSVAGLSDANADGFSDIVISSFFGDQTEVHSGMLLRDMQINAALDPLGAPDPILEDIAPVQVINANSIVGVNIRAAGDFDNDEGEDIIVGGLLLKGETSAGAVVYSGRDGSALARLPSNENAFFSGSSVAGVGDSNQDGYDDVVVASFLTKRTRVFLGRTGESFLGYKGETLADGFEDGFGFAVGNAGDVNQDGRPDWCVSTTGNSVHVYSGAVFFRLGDTLEGNMGDATISNPEDRDEAMIQCLKDAVLKLKVTASGGLAPKVRIIDAAGEKLATLNFDPNAADQKKLFKFPACAYYRLVVSGSVATTGSFTIDTSKSKFKGSSLQISGKTDASEYGGLIQFDLKALDGGKLSAKIKPLSGFQTIPTALLMSPFDLPIPVIPFASVKGGAFRLKNVPLIDGTGNHEFWVYGGTSDSAKIFYKIKMKQPFGDDTIDIDLDPPF